MNRGIQTPIAKPVINRTQGTRTPIVQRRTSLKPSTQQTLQRRSADEQRRAAEREQLQSELNRLYAEAEKEANADRRRPIVARICALENKLLRI